MYSSSCKYAAPARDRLTRIGLAVSLGFGYGLRGTWLERPKQFAPAQHDFKSTIKYLILLKI